MDDKEFVLEVVRDYLDEMKGYIDRAVKNKGRIKKRQISQYKSKKGNDWLMIYRPEYNGVVGIYIKRPQPKDWYTWYAWIPTHKGLTLFGFNKHVAQRISERFRPEMSPLEALKDMFIRTPAINQIEFDAQFYTRVNGGVCIGSAVAKRISINIGFRDLVVDLRDTNTFVSDEMLFEGQQEVTHESIIRGLERLGVNYQTDQDKEGF